MTTLQRPGESEAGQRRAEWAERVEGFARDAAPRTRPFAEALVAFVAPAPGERVLDVATGTGMAAVEAARRVGPGGDVLATDFIAEWEPHVVATAAEAGVANVRFAVMPAEALDLPDASFDVVLCQFGLMFVDEYVQTLREFRRVLRPGGRLGIAVWSEPEKVGVFLIPRLVAEALPPPPGDPRPSPVALGQPGLLERLVVEAGYREIVVERVTHTFAVVDAEEEWRRWSDGALNPAAKALAALPAGKQQALHERVLAALEAFRVDGTIRVPSEAVLVSAVR